ncbi:MAG: DUF6036 family nucleotidyltransferase [Bdellovibrionota bacterium]
MELDRALALKALKSLDKKLTDAGHKTVTLAVGGGGAMILEFGYSGSTVDIDAAPIGVEFESLKNNLDEVAKELKIAPDWLNPYYQTFTIYLPESAPSRMITSYSGKSLIVKTLAAEDILIMKLMAGRSKDMGHIRHLLKMKIDISIVDNRLDELKKLWPKLADKALTLLDDLMAENE